MRAPALVLRELSKRVGQQTLLDRVELELAPGELAVVTGHNGSGKTTLLELVAGLQSPDGGRIELGGRDATGAAPAERGLFYLPQAAHKYWALKDPALACVRPELSVLENLICAARGDEEAAGRALASQGMARWAGARPAQLSSGLQRRLALARAALIGPPLLLLDEPLISLDPESHQQMLAGIRAIRDAGATAMLYVTHDPREAAAFGVRRLVLERGKLAAPAARVRGGQSNGRLERQALPPSPVPRVRRRLRPGDPIKALIVGAMVLAGLLAWLAVALPAAVASRRRRPSGGEAPLPDELAAALAAGPAAAPADRSRERVARVREALAGWDLPLARERIEQASEEIEVPELVRLSADLDALQLLLDRLDAPRDAAGRTPAPADPAAFAEAALRRIEPHELQARYGLAVWLAAAGAAELAGRLLAQIGEQAGWPDWTNHALQLEAELMEDRR